MARDGNKVNQLIKCFYKHLTLLLFLVLPVKVTKVFLELSITLLITELRGRSNVEQCFDTDKFAKLLNTSYNKDILALPSYTLSWFWTEEALNQTIELREGNYSVRQSLVEENLLRHNLGTVANTIMGQLPLLMRVKLGLKDTRQRLSVRHELISILNQGLQPA